MTDPINGLTELAMRLRSKLDPDQPKPKKFILLFAYNGTGKTRLSSAFRDIGKQVDEDGQTTARDTLYFNAFTEDLFTWDNDLEQDTHRVLKFNSNSSFFDGIRELEMDTRIGTLLERYTDLQFYIDYEGRTRREKDSDGIDRDLPEGPHILFFRERNSDGDPIPIKPSRGEENIFVWCFFLAIVQLVLDGAEAYDWVKLIYIDDPVSSLDEHNAIVVANHLVQLYREADNVGVGTVISTHHQLFFNVLHYELKNHFNRPPQYTLSRDRRAERDIAEERARAAQNGEQVSQDPIPELYHLIEQKGDTPSFHHVAALVELDKVARGGTIHTYHFNMLRAVLEKTALFHGYTHFGKCIKRDEDDADGLLHQRFVDLLSHGKYSLFQPAEMGEETRGYFRKIVRDFLERYPFNTALFPDEAIPEGDPTL